MALGDIYQLRDKYHTTYGVEMENVYFFIGTGDGLALDLAQAFSDDWLVEIAELQPADVTHYALIVQSLFDPTDFVEFSTDQDGLWPVEASTPFSAMNFTQRLATRAIRAGHKRIGPVPEDAAQNGVIIDNDYAAQLLVVANLLNDVIEPNATPSATFQPVVVKRIKFTEDGKTKYRLPVDFGEAEFAPVINAVVGNRVSHQVSRERG